MRALGGLLLCYLKRPLSSWQSAAGVCGASSAKADLYIQPFASTPAQLEGCHRVREVARPFQMHMFASFTREINHQTLCLAQILLKSV
uniref:Putative secreted protein n=1 Tax=Anopheles triannulatus TaxID=58253 RepID=A0A2M4B6W3_9DIPT